MGVLHSINSSIMKFFVLLSVAALAFAAPMPEEGDESPAAVPYVHEEIEAEPYVHEEIAAEPYVDEDIPAVEYVHEEIPAEDYVHEEPAVPIVAYTGYPYVHAYAGYPYGAVAYAGLSALTAASPAVEAVAETKAAEPVAAPVAPLTYAYGYPYGFPAYFAHTGCVNSVGSVVPCAL